MNFTAKTLYGLENILENELKELGAVNTSILNRAVMFSGDLELLYRVNYCSRLALSVLVAAGSFRIRSKEDLYKGAKMINWSAFVDAGSTFSVVPVVNSKIFTHTGYPALIVKDAVADHFRDKYGKRPSVNSSDPSLLVNVHISNDVVNISIDSTVIPLFKRGYRRIQGPAPLNEVLAAGILRLSGWDGLTPLADPMCGSGTLPVEAGLIACRIPPGKFREYFGFTRWKNYDEDLFEKVRIQAESKICDIPVKIRASDISEEAVSQALQNIRSAGLSGQVNVERTDFRNSRGSEETGVLVFNPPYGERMKPDEPEQLYAMIGSTLKHSYPGYSAWLITAGKHLLKHVGLKPKTRLTLFNGALECVLAGFELYEGSKKHKGQVMTGEI